IEKRPSSAASTNLARSAMGWVCFQGMAFSKGETYHEQYVDCYRCARSKVLPICPVCTGTCYYILWLTPQTAFLEGINRGIQVNLEMGGVAHQGHPKTSAELVNTAGHGGFGQWVVASR